MLTDNPYLDLLYSETCCKLWSEVSLHYKVYPHKAGISSWFLLHRFYCRSPRSTISQNWSELKGSNFMCFVLWFVLVPRSHEAVLQCLIWGFPPGQGEPWHSRDLVLVPPPQVLVHGVHADQLLDLRLDISVSTSPFLFSTTSWLKDLDHER